MHKKHLGVLLVIAASFFWACESIVYKYSGSTDNVNMLAVRGVIIALIAALYLLITNKGDFRLKKKKISPLIYTAIAGTLVADTIYFFCLPHMNVVNALLIAHLQPIFVVLIGFFLLKEDRLTPYDYTGIGIMIVAAFLISAKTLHNIFALQIGTIWDLLVLISALGWASVVIVIRKHLKDLHAGTVILYRFGISAIAFIIFLAVTSSLVIPSKYNILIGVIVGLACICYYEGLRLIKGAEVSALETTTLLFSAVIGFFILGETVTSMQMFGILLLFVGVYFLAKKENHGSPS